MSSSGRPVGGRRVLVALDASPGSRAAAGAAARVAALLGAELVGLFVEDLDLLRLSSSPLAHRVEVLTSSSRRVERRDLEHEMKVQARRAEQALRRAADRVGIECSFRVSRGPVAERIVAESEASDLVSLGRYGWTLRAGGALGRTARALLARRGGRALFVQRRGELRPPIVVVFDGSAAGREALEQTLELAAPGRASVAILLTGEKPVELRRQAEAKLEGDVPVAHFYDLRGKPGTEGVVRAVERLRAGLLVVPLTRDRIGEDRLQALLSRLDCPVLVVS